MKGRQLFSPRPNSTTRILSWLHCAVDTTRSLQTPDSSEHQSLVLIKLNFKSLYRLSDKKMDPGQEVTLEANVTDNPRRFFLPHQIRNFDALVSTGAIRINPQTPGLIGYQLLNNQYAVDIVGDGSCFFHAIAFALTSYGFEQDEYTILNDYTSTRANKPTINQSLWTATRVKDALMHPTFALHNTPNARGMRRALCGPDSVIGAMRTRYIEWILSSSLRNAYEERDKCCESYVAGDEVATYHMFRDIVEANVLGGMKETNIKRYARPIFVIRRIAIRTPATSLSRWCAIRNRYINCLDMHLDGVNVQMLDNYEAVDAAWPSLWMEQDEFENDLFKDQKDQNRIHPDHMASLRVALLVSLSLARRNTSYWGGEIWTAIIPYAFQHVSLSIHSYDYDWVERYAYHDDNTFQICLIHVKGHYMIMCQSPNLVQVNQYEGEEPLEEQLIGFYGFGDYVTDDNSLRAL